MNVELVVKFAMMAQADGDLKPEYQNMTEAELRQVVIQMEKDRVGKASTPSSEQT